MKSYALAVVVAMLAAAGYVFQNAGDVTVRILLWERQMPQGVWEVLLFAAGALLMWIVSLFALLEELNPLKRKVAALEKSARSLEEEKTSLLRILENFRIPGTSRKDGNAAEETSMEALEIYAHPKMDEGEESRDRCLECEVAGEEDGAVSEKELAPDGGDAVEVYAHPKMAEDPSQELCLECEVPGEGDGATPELRSEEMARGAENSTVYLHASEEADKR